MSRIRDEVIGKRNQKRNQENDLYGQERARRAMRGSALGVAALFLTAAGVQAQFGIQQVGAKSGAQGVTVTAGAGKTGSVTAVEVLTLGASGLEFAQDAGVSTCASYTFSPSNQTCTESVTFTPAVPGPAHGGRGSFGQRRECSGHGLSFRHRIGRLGSAGSGETGSGSRQRQLPGLGDGRQCSHGRGALPAFERGARRRGQYVYRRQRSQPDSHGVRQFHECDYQGNHLRGARHYLDDCRQRESQLYGRQRACSGCDGERSVRRGTGWRGQSVYCGHRQSQGAQDRGSDRDHYDGGRKRHAGQQRGHGVCHSGPAQPSAGRDPGRQRQPLHRRHKQPSDPHGFGRNRDHYHGCRQGNHQRERQRSIFRRWRAGHGSGTEFPHAVAFDAAGNMYIPDTANNRVREVAAVGGAITAGSTITTFAGNGTPSFSGDGAAANLAELWGPSGVAVDAAGNVYIADTQNNAIRKVSPATLNISTLCGDGVGSLLLRRCR